MKLGLVTYQIAATWDINTIIEKCSAFGFEGVELRTTHKHGVEPSLSAKERAEVKSRFEDSPVKLVCLGSLCEYHSPEPAVVQENIDTTKEFILLAKDVGAQGVKVRPNALPDGVPREKTIEQIGRALQEVALFASDYGIKIRLEVHGKDSCYPPYIKQMIDIAGHPNLYVCWNSNDQDIDETGSIEKHFNMLKDRIEICHIHELSSKYPWESLFFLLKKADYKGFCLAEVSASSEPDRFMQYYRALFHALVRLSSYVYKKQEEE